MLSTTPTISPMRRALSAMPRMHHFVDRLAAALGQLRGALRLAAGLVGVAGGQLHGAPAASCWRRFLQ